MTDGPGTPEDSRGLIQPWLAQLRKITEELAGMTGLSESVFARPVPSLPDVPLPGAISAAQLNAIASALAAQRSSVAALKAQLTAFDESSRRWRKSSARWPSGVRNGQSSNGW